MQALESKTAIAASRQSGCQIGAHLVNHGLVVWLAKDGTARHKGVRTGIGHSADVAFLDAAVHFQSNVLAAGVDALAHGFDLAQGAVDEALAAKAGVHAHEQNQVQIFNHPVQHIQWHGGVEHQTGLDAVRLDVLDAAVHVGRCIRVEADVVCSCLGKGGRQLVHGLDHQVHIDGHRLAFRRDGMRLERLADHGAKGEIGNVMVVHHVKVNPVSASCDNSAYFLTQTGEVGRQDGRSDTVRGVHAVNCRSYHSHMPKYEFQVEAQAQYEAEQSAPQQGLFRFSYTITVTNTGDAAAQLIARHWYITDASETQQEVHGLGVVGRQPLLQPGESFTYSSGCELRTSSGSMHGHYLCVSETGETFEAPIAPFVLDASLTEMHLHRMTSPSSRTLH